jgi:hypothetical protein
MVDPPVTVTALCLDADSGYQESPTATGAFTTGVPVPLRPDFDALGEPTAMAPGGPIMRAGPGCRRR